MFFGFNLVGRSPITELSISVNKKLFFPLQSDLFNHVFSLFPVHTLPNLTVLSLSGCSKITDDGIELIAENLRKLRLAFMKTLYSPQSPLVHFLPKSK